MTVVESLRREPGRESTQPRSPLFQHEGAPSDLSPEAKDHFTRVESIASVALKDLADVAAEIEQLREEIMMRARMIGQATVRLDELRSKAAQGYGTIRNALDMIRQEFAAIPATAPDIDDMADEKQGPDRSAK